MTENYNFFFVLAGLDMQRTGINGPLENTKKKTKHSDPMWHRHTTKLEKNDIKMAHRLNKIKTNHIRQQSVIVQLIYRSRGLTSPGESET